MRRKRTFRRRPSPSDMPGPRPASMLILAPDYVPELPRFTTSAYLNYITAEISGKDPMRSPMRPLDTKMTFPAPSLPYPSQTNSLSRKSTLEFNRASSISQQSSPYIRNYEKEIAISGPTRRISISTRLSPAKSYSSPTESYNSPTRSRKLPLEHAEVYKSSSERVKSHKQLNSQPRKSIPTNELLEAHRPAIEIAQSSILPKHRKSAATEGSLYPKDDYPSPEIDDTSRYSIAVPQYHKQDEYDMPVYPRGNDFSRVCSKDSTRVLILYPQRPTSDLPSPIRALLALQTPNKAQIIESASPTAELKYIRGSEKKVRPVHAEPTRFNTSYDIECGPVISKAQETVRRDNRLSPALPSCPDQITEDDFEPIHISSNLSLESEYDDAMALPLKENISTSKPTRKSSLLRTHIASGAPEKGQLRQRISSRTWDELNASDSQYYSPTIDQFQSPGSARNSLFSTQSADSSQVEFSRSWGSLISKYANLTFDEFQRATAYSEFDEPTSVYDDDEDGITSVSSSGGTKPLRIVTRYDTTTAIPKSNALRHLLDQIRNEDRGPPPPCTYTTSHLDRISLLRRREYHEPQKFNSDESLVSASTLPVMHSCEAIRLQQGFSWEEPHVSRNLQKGSLTDGSSSASRLHQGSFKIGHFQRPGTSAPPKHSYKTSQDLRCDSPALSSQAGGSGTENFSHSNRLSNSHIFKSQDLLPLKNPRHDSRVQRNQDVMKHSCEAIHLREGFHVDGQSRQLQYSGDTRSKTSSNKSHAMLVCLDYGENYRDSRFRINDFTLGRNRKSLVNRPVAVRE